MRDGWHSNNMIPMPRLLAYLRKCGLRRRQSAYAAMKQLGEVGFIIFRPYPDGITFLGYARDYPMLDTMARIYLHATEGPPTGTSNTCDSSTPARRHSPRPCRTQPERHRGESLPARAFNVRDSVALQVAGETEGNSRPNVEGSSPETATGCAAQEHGRAALN